MATLVIIFFSLDNINKMDFAFLDKIKKIKYILDWDRKLIEEELENTPAFIEYMNDFGIC